MKFNSNEVGGNFSNQSKEKKDGEKFFDGNFRDLFQLFGMDSKRGNPRTQSRFVKRGDEKNLGSQFSRNNEKAIKPPVSELSGSSHIPGPRKIQGPIERTSMFTPNFYDPYQGSEEIKKQYIGLLNRDLKYNRNVNDQTEIKKWIDEVEDMEKDNFFEFNHESTQYPNVYLLKYLRYYCDELMKMRGQYDQILKRYSVIEQNSSREIEELKASKKKKIDNLSRINASLREDNVKLVRERRDVEEQEKKFSREVQNLKTSKRQLITTFRMILDEIESKNQNVLETRKKESRKAIKNWSSRTRDSRTVVTKSLRNLRDKIEKMIDREKKNTVKMSSKLENIYSSQDQKFITNLRERIFDRIALSLNIQKSSNEKKE